MPTSLDQSLGLIGRSDKSNQKVVPCPACKKKPEIWSDIRGFAWYQCEKCGLEGPAAYEEAEDQILQSGSCMSRDTMRLKRSLADALRAGTISGGAFKKGLKAIAIEEARHAIAISRSKIKSCGKLGPERKWNAYVARLVKRIKGKS